MKILSHRGYWTEASEKNTTEAFLSSFKKGYGTETDVRDQNSNLVISHDIPNGDPLSFDSFLKLASLHSKAKNKLTIAINIKSDGLAMLVKNHLDEYENLDCFVFDMSIPDMRSYLNYGIQVFTRLSEFEVVPVFLEYSSGIWLDSFNSDWFDELTISHYLKMGKKVCVVSSELHGRDNLNLWSMLRSISYQENLLLCTDYPELAHKFFKTISYEN
jgi:hypothetical protein